MKLRSRLKHVAAGLLGSLISRNNDVNGYWTPGLLYRDVSAPPHAVEMDLLSRISRPASDCTELMVARYVTFLRAAMEKQKFGWEELTRTTITFRFNVEVPDPHFRYPCAGDPFICTVTLESGQGKAVTMTARARCKPYRPDVFTQSARPGPPPTAQLNSGTSG